MNEETKKINLSFAFCDDPDAGEFDVIEMDFITTLGEIILPFGIFEQFALIYHFPIMSFRFLKFYL